MPSAAPQLPRDFRLDHKPGLLQEFPSCLLAGNVIPVGLHHSSRGLYRRNLCEPE